MKVVTARQMQEIDRATIEELGLPGPVLMGMAGRAVADHITGHFPSIRRAAVFSGPGNNGGDGFVTAFFLFNRNVPVDIFLTGSPEKISDTSRIYFNLCKNSGIKIKPVAVPGDIAVIALDEYDLIVDAMLGTGFTGSVKGIIADVIRLINDADVPVLSIDVPSGLGSDGAASEGEAIIADRTVTIGLPKISLVTYPGMHYCGALHVADIGFPSSLTESGELKSELIDTGFFKKYMAREIESAYCCMGDTHKGAKGHLLLMGGFDGMEGAIMMTARAALETGVGLVSLATTASARQIIAGAIPELITKALPEIFSPSQSLVTMLADMLAGRRYDVLVIGPGMGRSAFAQSVFEAMVGNIHQFGVSRVLIDGDGLYHLPGYLENHDLDSRVEFIITPHFMEASRLTGIQTDVIMKNRHEAAGMLAMKFSCVALLKGPATIVTDGERYFINTSGSPSLATGGSGDVLSGVIGSLLLRKFSSLHAAAIGAYVHGRAAEYCCSKYNTDILKATDLLPHIRNAKSSVL